MTFCRCRQLTAIVAFTLSTFAATAAPIALNDPAWKQAGPGNFEVSNGEATSHGGMGLYWLSSHEIENGSLYIDFLTPRTNANSGIFVRFPNPGKDPWVAVKQGYEIQIDGNTVADNHTGAIYKLQAPTHIPLKPVGEWNSYAIHMVDQWIAVVLNGELINIFRTEKDRGDVRGYFGIQNHDDSAAVVFRNVRVVDAPVDLPLADVLINSGLPASQLVRYKAKRKPEAPWFEVADHGPAFAQTFADWYAGEPRSGAAKKGLLLTPQAGTDFVALFDTETLKLVTATTEGTALDNTPWKAKHGQENKILNENKYLFNSAEGIGWADAQGQFDDPRPIKGYGNLPYATFNGYYRHGAQVVLDYSVHDSRILEAVVMNRDSLCRRLEIAPHQKDFHLHIANDPSGWTFRDGKLHAISKSPRNDEHILIELAGASSRFIKKADKLTVSISASDKTESLFIVYSKVPKADFRKARGELAVISRGSLYDVIKGGKGISTESFEVQAKLSPDDKTWVVDDIPLPPLLAQSPYRSDVRISDFDFFADGDRAALSTWDGEIWTVTGLKDFKTLTWKRFATGMFEPLGLKIVNDVIHVNARDGIYQLHDLNSNGECDHYQVFNNDVIITANFHEFSFGLEQDKAGNFYFTKASPVVRGGRGFDKILPHNGTILKVTPDGKAISVLATGLRAPGGIGVGPNGEITTGENEGTWQPACKLNLFNPKNGPSFFGVENSAHELAGQKLHDPVLYFPMSWDNSGGGQIWIPENNSFGLPGGTLMHLSYGRSSIYRIFTQEIDGKLQGAAARLPVDIGSSAQRACFHPDGSMYICGFRGWQTNAANSAAFQRIRYTGKTSTMPTHVEVTKEGIKLGFAVELDAELANDPTSFSIEKWKYIRSEQYGSGHFSIDNPDREAERNATKGPSKKHRSHDKVKVSSAKLLDDKKTVLITIENHAPAEQVQISYDLEDTEGTEIIGKTMQTIYSVPK